jgi:uncharacterized protein DUF5946
MDLQEGRFPSRGRRSPTSTPRYGPPRARIRRGITMAMTSAVRCVGCGAWVPDTTGPVPRYMTAAPACRAMYGELNAWLLTDPTAGAFRQWRVDAYAVQHPGEQTEQAIQSVAIRSVPGTRNCTSRQRTPDGGSPSARSLQIRVSNRAAWPSAAKSRLSKFCNRSVAPEGGHPNARMTGVSREPSLSTTHPLCVSRCTAGSRRRKAAAARAPTPC